MLPLPSAATQLSGGGSSNERSSTLPGAGCGDFPAVAVVVAAASAAREEELGVAGADLSSGGSAAPLRGFFCV